MKKILSKTTSRLIKFAVITCALFGLSSCESKDAQNSRLTQQGTTSVSSDQSESSSGNQAVKRQAAKGAVHVTGKKVVGPLSRIVARFGSKTLKVVALAALAVLVAIVALFTGFAKFIKGSILSVNEAQTNQVKAQASLSHRELPPVPGGYGNLPPVPTKLDKLPPVPRR